MPYAELAVYCSVGILLIVFGLLVCKKQKVSLLHDYHYRSGKEKDLPAYCRAMWIGQIVIGAGLCLTGLLRFFTGSFYSWIAAILAGIVGLWIFHKAQMKYNGSWFS